MTTNDWVMKQRKRQPEMNVLTDRDEFNALFGNIAERDDCWLSIESLFKSEAKTTVLYGPCPRPVNTSVKKWDMLYFLIALSSYLAF